MMTAAPEPRAVLAYGTLRPGYGNHRLVANLLESTEPASVPGFSLYVPGHRWFPYARATVGGAVVGDVLRFSERDWPEALARMDALEGHPSHYRRQMVATSAGEAWLYVDAAPEPGTDWTVLESGDWHEVEAPATAGAMSKGGAT